MDWRATTAKQASEYVNHKSYNRLTVGNHNDTAGACRAIGVPETWSRTGTESYGISATGHGVTLLKLTKSGTSMARRRRPAARR